MNPDGFGNTGKTQVQKREQDRGSTTDFHLPRAAHAEAAELPQKATGESFNSTVPLRNAESCRQVRMFGCVI